MRYYYYNYSSYRFTVSKVLLNRFGPSFMRVLPMSNCIVKAKTRTTCRTPLTLPIILIKDGCLWRAFTSCSEKRAIHDILWYLIATNQINSVKLSAYPPITTLVTNMWSETSVKVMDFSVYIFQFQFTFSFSYFLQLLLTYWLFFSQQIDSVPIN